MSKKKKRKNIDIAREIIGIIIISFGVLSAISLISDKTGIIGVFLRSIFFTLMGFGG